MRDFHPGQMCGDGFATAGVRALLSFMGSHCRRALRISRFRRLDRSEDLRLVEQHLLIRRDPLPGELLRGAAVELVLQEAHLFLKEHLALERLTMLSLKLLV